MRYQESVYKKRQVSGVKVICKLKKKKERMKKISYLHFHQLTAGRHWNVNYPVRNEAAEQLKCFNHKQKN